MATRLQQFLLGSLICMVSLTALAQGDNHKDDGNVLITPIVVVEPNRQQREGYEGKIDTEFFEVGFYTGIIAIEDFGSSTVTGLKASFHATEDFFLQANLGKSEAGYTSYESSSTPVTPLFLDRDYEYYNLLVGYNLFPGETFITQNLTFNSAFYLVAGAGNTSLNEDSHFTLTFGTGYRIILRDWLTVNMDFRDHSFKSQLVPGVSKRTHNLEFSTGLTAFF